MQQTAVGAAVGAASVTRVKAPAELRGALHMLLTAEPAAVAQAVAVVGASEDGSEAVRGALTALRRDVPGAVATLLRVLHE